MPRLRRHEAHLAPVPREFMDRMSDYSSSSAQYSRARHNPEMSDVDCWQLVSQGHHLGLSH